MEFNFKKENQAKFVLDWYFNLKRKKKTKKAKTSFMDVDAKIDELLKDGLVLYAYDDNYSRNHKYTIYYTSKDSKINGTLKFNL